MSDAIIYEAEVTGMPVRAVYSQRSVEKVFLPLIEDLRALRKEKGRRILVFLAAPPATGKSTLSGFLATLCPEMTVLAMDGYHHYQSWLLEHTTIRDGKTVPMVSVKGAPETFDLEKLQKDLARAAAGEIIGWPIYDRAGHDPVENAVTAEGEILLLEGNYLLLDEAGWRDLKQYADYTIMIRAEESMLRPRLIERKLNLGRTQAEAEKFADESDLPNARLILRHSSPADLTLRLTETGEYRPE